MPSVILTYIIHTRHARGGNMVAADSTPVMILDLVPPYVNAIHNAISAAGIKKGDNNNNHKKIPSNLVNSTGI